jgi:hypothetical protein
MEISVTYFLGWAETVIPLISASQVAEVTNMCHHVYPMNRLSRSSLLSLVA